jgi:ABC-2 type transport system permease protein
VNAARPSSTARRYARLLAVQVRASLALAMQYRADFLIDGAIEVLWTSTALTPLFVVYGRRTSIAGWSLGQALVVVGFFTLLQAVLEGVINPSLVAIVEHIRKGTLDFVLLKPADAQFLVSTARIHPWRSINVFTALILFGVAFRDLHRWPDVGSVALALVLLGTSLTTLYSLWLLVMCTAFYAVKIDNVSELFSAVFDAARWPSSVFRGVVRILFTFVVPLALMTTVPARALLGELEPTAAIGAVFGTVVFACLARWVWLRALAGYTSAGG